MGSEDETKALPNKKTEYTRAIDQLNDIHKSGAALYNYKPQDFHWQLLKEWK